MGFKFKFDGSGLVSLGVAGHSSVGKEKCKHEDLSLDIQDTQKSQVCWHSHVIHCWSEETLWTTSLAIELV